jgi:hypothetical protein
MSDSGECDQTRDQGGAGGEAKAGTAAAESAPAASAAAAAAAAAAVAEPAASASVTPTWMDERDEELPAGHVWCPNSELCGASQPEWALAANHGMCANCAATFRHPLRFVDGPRHCAICLEDCDRLAEHPASCGHYFCMQCTREHHWPDENIQLDPIAFGAPPCPHTQMGIQSCPSRPCELEHGFVMGCDACEPTLISRGMREAFAGLGYLIPDEYEWNPSGCPLSKVFAQWEHEHPEQRDQWNNAELRAIAEVQQRAGASNADHCPLCRRSTMDSSDARWHMRHNPKKRKQKPNEKCACGSGKKFKKCCRRR